MAKFLKKDVFVGNENKEKLDEFVNSNSKEIKVWLGDFVEFYNKCGEKTKNGAIQLGFAGTMMFAMLKSMKHVEKKKKIKMLKYLEKEIKKQ